MSEYKVEKTRFPVKLYFGNGVVKEGELYLSVRAAHHEGRERAIDVLNQTDLFIPIYFNEEPVKLTNKENILMVSFPSEEEEPEDSVFADIKVEVVIHLVDHTQLEGNFFFMLPTHARRVKDFLNQPDSFLEMKKGSDIYLINKKHILFVEEKQRG